MTDEIISLRAELERVKEDRDRWSGSSSQLEADLAKARISEQKWLTIAEEYQDRAHKAEALAAELARERDAALEKWHAHQKNVPCAGCEGGHDTFWKTVIESPQWERWRSVNSNFDVDECEGCGHISQDHFQAFIKSITDAEHDALAKKLAAVREALSKLIRDFEAYMGAVDAGDWSDGEARQQISKAKAALPATSAETKEAAEKSNAEMREAIDECQDGGCRAAIRASKNGGAK